MMNYFKNNQAVDAIIYLKNGTRKYGMLINNSLKITDTFHFISNTNFHLFQKSNNPELIEILQGNSISAIDTDLK
ncbi:MAG: hypothetical protein V4608_14160 [Bacteroidota bacterium]